MSRIDRIRHPFAARRVARTTTDAEIDDVGPIQLPVAITAPAAAPPPRMDRRHGDSEFTAQLIGQDGQRRGLRAGPALLDRARTTYNGVEWSGARDRRAHKGHRAKTET